ncbi:MAG: T9SS type A sorting domain-containing protein, partial [Ferruginibacter sp.]
TGPCAATAASGSIIVNAPPTAPFSKTNVSACNATNDGSITVTPGGVGPFNYAWTGVTGSGNPATTPYSNPGNVNAITGLPIGFYNVTVTDANGCSVSITNIHIQYAFSSYITNSGSTSSGCGNTGSIILYVNAGVGPYTYSLDGTSYQAGNTFTGLAAANYTAYVKDAAGCVSTKSIVVAAAAPIVVSPYARAASSCSADGSIEIYRSGGISPFTYSLDGTTYQSGNTFTGLNAGNYVAFVKDSKGCTGSQPVTVGQGAALNVTVSKTNTSTCTTDGTIQVMVSGGFAPYTYSKNGGSTYQVSNSFTGLGASSYPITVKDAKGCLGSLNVTINLNPISVTSYIVNASGCGMPNGSIQLFRTGGVGPYSYSLDGNTYQSSTTFSGLLPGTYDAYVKDSKTCIGFQFGIQVGPNNCGTRSVKSANGNVKTTTVVAKNASPVKLSANVLKINAYPNPSNTSFKVVMEGNSSDKVMITVTDVFGRKVYQSEGTINQQYSFGHSFTRGIYMLQVVQGNEKQTARLIKE